MFAAGVALIGKEANKVGEFGEGYPVNAGVIEFAMYEEALT